MTTPPGDELLMSISERKDDKAMIVSQYRRRYKVKLSRSTVIIVISMMASFSLLESCKKEANGWQGTMRTENGVVIVENPSEPLYKNAALILTEELSFGGKD